MPEIIFWADALYLALRTPILNMPEYPTPWLPYLQDGRNYFVSKKYLHRLFNKRILHFCQGCDFTTCHIVSATAVQWFVINIEMVM